MLVRRGGSAEEAVRRPERLLAGLFAHAPGRGARAEAVVPGAGETCAEDFLGQWLGGNESRALACVVEGLRAVTTWDGWMNASHVLTRKDFDDDLELTEFERALERDLGSLEAVCRSPRTLLRPEEERVSVARVRRVSSRTVIDLLGRPRDWERRTLHGVEPSRALTVATVEDWDLYENRVAARLVDRLLPVLGRRIEHLSRVQGLLEEGLNFADETRHSHWRRDRLNRAWARVAFDGAVGDRVAATVRALRRMRDLLLGLKTTPLYENVPRGAQVEATLRPTNVFVNDAHYCKVARLWRLAVEEEQRTTIDAAAQVKLRRADAARFDDYAHLLVLQALGSIGYAPNEADVMAGSALRLKGRRGEVQVCRGADGTTSLRIGDGSLAVVALPTRLVAGELQAAWSLLQEEKVPTLFMLHGEADVLLGDLADDSPCRRAFAGWMWPRVLVVSPVSLDAVERVGRVINQWDVTERLRGHPHRVVSKGFDSGALPSWAAAAQGVLALRRPFGGAELREHGAALERKASGGTPRLRELLKEASSYSWAVSCPLCRSDRCVVEDRWDPALSVDQQTFWVRCAACKAEWGVARCGRCRRTYPALKPSFAFACPVEVERLDQAYGRDLWSELRRGMGERPEVCCPTCP